MAAVTIAFIGYEQANLGCIVPVMAALQQQRIAEPLFVAGVDFKEHRGLHTAQTPAGIRGCAPESVLSATQRRTARQRGLALARAARRWAAAGGAAGPADERLAAAQLQGFFDAPRMSSICTAYATVEQATGEILRRERPALVVVSEDSDYLRGRLVCRIAAAHGIPVACLTPWYYSAFIGYPLTGARRADHYLVGTPRHARRLVAAGAPPRAVTVVGHPEFDALRPTAPPPPGHFVFALQGFRWEREIAADLAAIFADEPEARLTIKPHPALRTPAWLARLAPPRNVRVAPSSADAAALLARTHCLIARSSRMLWEASIRGGSVLITHYDALPLGIDVPPRDRRAVVVRSGAALRERVRATLAGHGRGLNRAMIAPHHPHATARAVAALRALLG